MKVKLGLGLTIRIDTEEDIEVTKIKEVAKKYIKEGKYQINNVTFKADYTDEGKPKEDRK